MKILIALLLMTSVCFANKDIYSLDDQYNFKYYEIDGNKLIDHSVKISCPDGYILEGKFFDRNKFYRIRKILNLSGNKYYETFTDAELKCVEDK